MFMYNKLPSESNWTSNNDCIDCIVTPLGGNKFTVKNVSITESFFQKQVFMNPTHKNIVSPV